MLRYIVLCITLTVLGVAREAHATDEIIVTARKRPERLEDVPASVSVLSATEIDDFGIRGIEDIASRIPGFSFAPLLGGASSTPVIRGMSTTIGEPNVGFFIDGIYQSSRWAMDAPLAYDVSRVEVLRGAQNALYGRNTFAGAVNFITARPAHSFEARAEATVGSYDEREVKIDVSGPIAPHLTARVTGLSSTRSGYFTNTLTGRPLDPRETKLGTLSLAAEPDADVRAYGHIAYENTRKGDEPLHFVANNAVPFDPTSRGLPPALQVFRGEIITSRNDFVVTPGSFQRRNLTSSLTIEIGRLTAITGYNDLAIAQQVDNDLEARSIRFLTQSIDDREISQEIRFTSPITAPFFSMLGGYFYRFDGRTNSQDRYVGQAATLAPALQILSGLPSLDNVTKETTENYALFGEVASDLTPRLKASIAARWSIERKAVKSQDTNPLSGVSAVFANEKTFNSFVPTATLTFKPQDELMLYASVSRGTKAGGFNVSTTAGAVLPSERTYEPEWSWNYEVGSKIDLGGQSQVGVAVYLIKWDDQIVRALGANFALLNANAGESTAQGIEFEFAAEPVAHVQISGGFSYTDASYDHYTFGALTNLGVNPILDGIPLQYVSRYAGHLSMRMGKELFGQIDASYRSPQSAVQTADAYLGASFHLNVRAGVAVKSLEIVVWIRNLTDDAAAASGAFIPNPARRFDFAQGLTGASTPIGLEAFGGVVGASDPRTFGVTASVHL